MRLSLLIIFLRHLNHTFSLPSGLIFKLPLLLRTLQANQDSIRLRAPYKHHRYKTLLDIFLGVVPVFSAHTITQPHPLYPPTHAIDPPNSHLLDLSFSFSSRSCRSCLRCSVTCRSIAYTYATFFKAPVSLLPSHLPHPTEQCHCAGQDHAGETRVCAHRTVHMS
jgi:hypothetical protein